MQAMDNSILDQHNQSLGSYSFSISSGEHNTGNYFCNDFVGLPSIPQIGKYGKFGYETNNVGLLAAMECIFTKEGKVITTNSSEELAISEDVKQILMNIPDKIKINQNKDKKPNQNNQKNNRNNYGKNKPKYIKKHDAFEDDHIQQTMEEEKINADNEEDHDHTEKPNIQDAFNQTKYPKAVCVNFLWTVSFQSENTFINKDGDSLMNLVIHPYVFQVINFEATKRDFKQVPLCIVSPFGVSEYYEAPHQAVSFGELRSEYLSVHLKGPSLCFSPNNMKFYMQSDCPISTFYSIVLSEDGFHYVTYHWNVNDSELKGQLQELFASATSLKGILEFLPIMLPPDNPAVIQVIQLFEMFGKKGKNQQKDTKE